ncbi:hypothetical protein SLA2020_425470 [Shorea laevis]
MRLLVQSGFFAKTKVHENEEEEAYGLTPSSRLVLKDNVTSLSPFVLAMLDPVMVSPWHVLGNGFEGVSSRPLRKCMGWVYGTTATKTRI